MFFAIIKSGDCIVNSVRSYQTMPFNAIQYQSMLCNTDRVYWHQMTSMTARAMMMRSTDNKDDDANNDINDNNGYEEIQRQR